MCLRRYRLIFRRSAFIARIVSENNSDKEIHALRRLLFKFLRLIHPHPY
jgi:hypothetical protein